MEIPDGNFRHILLYYFRKGKNAVQAWKKFYDVYGEISLTERQCQNGFAEKHKFTKSPNEFPFSIHC